MSRRRASLAIALIALLVSATPMASSEQVGSDPSGLVLDIPKLIGISASEVKSLLGEPGTVQSTSCVSGQCPRYIYQAGKLEIVFIRDKVDWVTLYPESLPYTKESLAKLGLPVKAPTFSNSQHMRWDRALLGYREVALFAGGRGANGQTKVWYTYVYATMTP